MSTDYLARIAHWNIRPAVPAAGRCALLVIDMQEHFRFTAAGILDNIAALVQACRKSNMPVIFTRHGHRDTASDGGMLGVWWSDLIRCGSPAWELLPEIAPGDAGCIIDKKRYSAFAGTDLDARLQANGVRELIITGVLTNCCCETTARDAFVRDFRVFFVCDATATVSEELHVASLQNLAFGFAHVVSTVQLLQQLGDPKALASGPLP